MARRRLTTVRRRLHRVSCSQWKIALITFAGLITLNTAGAGYGLGAIGVIATGGVFGFTAITLCAANYLDGQDGGLTVTDVGGKSRAR